MAVPNILTDADISTLRREWLDDYIDARAEWASATVKTAASLGDTSLELENLSNTGTLKRGTPIQVVETNGYYHNYVVQADVTISSGNATISINPPLLGDVIVGTKAVAPAYKKSLFNKNNKRGLFFTDDELQDFARQAQSNRGHWIIQARDQRQALYRTIRFYAWSSMLAADEYVSAVLSSNPSAGNQFIAAKRTILSEDESIVFSVDDGRTVVELVR